MDETFTSIAGTDKRLLTPRHLNIIITGDDIGSLVGVEESQEPLFTLEFNPALRIDSEREMELVHAIADTDFMALFAAMMGYLRETPWRAPLKVILKGDVPPGYKRQIKWTLDNYANRKRVPIKYSGI